jgi:hypothetical protein
VDKRKTLDYEHIFDYGNSYGEFTKPIVAGVAGTTEISLSDDAHL